MTALFVLFSTAIFILFAGLWKNRQLLHTLALGGTLIAMIVSAYDYHFINPWNTAYASMLSFDSYALAFTSVTLAGMLLLLGLSHWEFRDLENTLGDHYGLIFFSLCGALCMFSFNNMIMLFLGVEILSIPLYVLAGSRRNDLRSNEAALKYFLMGAFATGILLFGMALVYGATGAFDLHAIQLDITEGRASGGILNVGILMILMGLSFKVSAAPFHFWAPDVYQGSPNMVTAFMATVVKTAGFAAFYRLFSLAFVDAGFWHTAVAAISALTMTLANTTAIFQQDFKRMLAYSSIAHAGYLLMAVLAAGQPGSGGAILTYTLVYSAATVVAFGVFMLVSEQNEDSSFKAFNGLGKKQPLLAIVMTLAMLSLAGIPPTAGFFGKYFLFIAAFEQYPWLVILAVVNSAISIYYYFKVIIAMYFSREENEYRVEVPAGIRLSMIAGLVLIVLLTIMPATIYNLI